MVFIGVMKATFRRDWSQGGLQGFMKATFYSDQSQNVLHRAYESPILSETSLEYTSFSY